MTKPRPNELQGLHQFTGTTKWWKHPFHPRFLFTDGIKHVAETAKAYWLLDVIFSHAAAIHRNPEIKQSSKLLLVFKLAVSDDDTAKFTTEDGNKKVIKQGCQDISCTDFPARNFTCWMSNNVLLLPSEY
ncbi:MAG: hypothetical protein JJ975_05935 [Bacteroidia bacterium]|nr:hypothetical protein [Bacteroidia bacterium]